MLDTRVCSSSHTIGKKLRDNRATDAAPNYGLMASLLGRLHVAQQDRLEGFPNYSLLKP